VSEGSAVAGLITPGCYVDVIATFNNGDQQVATTVVHNVKVQFVQRAKPPRSSGSSSSATAAGSPDALGAVKTVTLLVTPRQANAIELANNQGKPRLILRGGSDDTEVVDSSVNRNELLGIPDEPPAPPVVAAPPPPPVEAPVTDMFEEERPEPVVNKHVVQVIRGGNETTEYFEEDGNRSFEPGGSAMTAANRQAPRRTRRQPATQPSSQQQQQQQPPTTTAPLPPQQEDEDGPGQPRTASGASPGDLAPRAEQVRGNLRKGM